MRDGSGGVFFLVPDELLPSVGLGFLFSVGEGAMDGWDGWPDGWMDGNLRARSSETDRQDENGGFGSLVEDRSLAM